jgi:hypothetical protein
MWEETNVNKLYLKLKGTTPITCKECKALEAQIRISNNGQELKKKAVAKKRGRRENA